MPELFIVVKSEWIGKKKDVNSTEENVSKSFRNWGGG